MLAPEQDLADRRPVWDALQVFWMDTDPEPSLELTAQVCAQSKYTLPDLEQIFWNEVRPALKANLRSVAGEWAGCEIGWLSNRILEVNRFGRRLPVKSLYPEEGAWWTRLRAAVERRRGSEMCET
jgi:hypothetical protein